MLGRSFTRKELQLNQLKHEQLQIDFATLAHDDRIKLVHHPVKHETVIFFTKRRISTYSSWFSKMTNSPNVLTRKEKTTYLQQ